MLAGVVELVLHLTIAKEKIELSAPITSAVCVSACNVFVAFSCVCVCVRAHMSLPVCCLEGHSCSTIIFPM